MKTIPVLLSAPDDNWLQFASEAIWSVVEQQIENEGKCSFMLTGGGTAEQLYRYWAELYPCKHDKITYFLGDERCVPPDDADSNFGMIKRTMFPSGIPDGCVFHRMKGEVADFDDEANRYASILPNSVDVLLLSVGPDGHVASLFPESQAVFETSRLVVPIVGPKLPYERLTITPQVIRAAKSVFVLATGAEKGRVLANALLHLDDVLQLPVRIASKSSWLLDKEAAAQLNN